MSPIPLFISLKRFSPLLVTVLLGAGHLNEAQATAQPLPTLPSSAMTQPSAQQAPAFVPSGEWAMSRRAGATRTVKATAYNSEVAQTDNSPFITATGTRVRPGVVALSRDLLRVFPYGTRVTLQDKAGLLNGRVFTVEDTMHVRKVNTVDIWMPSRSQALKWGVRSVKITALR
ncbi:3D domain-containing protein [Deinococcus sp.]|uniref:3D domain-containing protein n=1 Tax=Deinococcus sp. TaxID=47478 RepID=UPI003B5AF7A6